MRVPPAGVCLVLVLILFGAAPARAGERLATTGGVQITEARQIGPAPLFAALSLSKFFSLADRDNVVRVCVFVKAVALFIMLKKFNN